MTKVFFKLVKGLPYAGGSKPCFSNLLEKFPREIDLRDLDF